MREQIVDALKGHNADYIEIRLEDGKSSRLQYRGQELEDIGQSTGSGGNVRALVNGGWGFISFNDPGELRAKVELAVKQARLVGNEKSLIAQSDPIVDIVPLELIKDPLSISLNDKKRLLD